MTRNLARSGPIMRLEPAIPPLGGLLLQLLFLTACALPPGGEVDPPDLVGSWKGGANTPDGLLALELDLERAGSDWSGRFRIPAEGVDVPLQEVRTSGDSLIVELAPDRRIRGRIDVDSISGALEIGPRAMPVVLARAGTRAAHALSEKIARSAEGGRAPLVETARGPMRSAVDAEALDRLVSKAEAAGSRSLVVLRDGRTVGAWHAGGERRRVELMSATKSVLNLAVGRLLTTGAVASIDEPVHTYFPEWRNDGRSRITIRHLLNHTSGLASPPPAEIYQSEDFVRFALESELVADPGTQAEYNNNATNLLAGVIGEVAGAPIDEFLAGELFAPLGITDFGWSRDPAGNPHGMAGLQMHAEDLALLGQLVLQEGAWEGTTLIDAAWFDVSLQPGSALHEGVGLLWWLIRDRGETIGYRADGYLGQYLVIYPAAGIVGVRLVEGSPSYDPGTDGFRDFEELLRELVPPGGAADDASGS